MTEADFAVKEKNVLRLVDEALRLASDTEDCGKVPLTSSHVSLNMSSEDCPDFKTRGYICNIEPLDHVG